MAIEHDITRESFTQSKIFKNILLAGAHMAAFLNKATYEEYQGVSAKKLINEWNSACTEFVLDDTQQENSDNNELMEDIAEDLRKAKAMTVMLLHADFSILLPATLHDYFDELNSLITVAESQFECLQ
jgi:hypothetical protein